MAVPATEADVAARTSGAFVATDRVRIGAEVEWLVFHRDDPSRAVSAEESRSIADGALPAGGHITIEPGAQVELVTQPTDGPAALVEAINADTEVLVERFAAHDRVLVPLGFDPYRQPKRTLFVDRYEAMEQYFSRVSPAGLKMMNLTAALQLSIDFGPDPATTWRTAHHLAPLLCATFANSPTPDGTESWPISHRQAIWAATDPTRTRPVGPEVADWHRYVLDAHTMLRHDSDRAAVVMAELDQPFGDWLQSSNPPSVDELDRHLTTLFPPLRPRGFLELRMIDAVPAEGRAAAIACVWVLLTNPSAAAPFVDRMAELHRDGDPWAAVLNEGLNNVALRQAAEAMLASVAATLKTTDPDLAKACTQWQTQILAHPK